jgi:hypothetical protein
MLHRELGMDTALTVPSNRSKHNELCSGDNTYDKCSCLTGLCSVDGEFKYSSRGYVFL